MTRETDTMPTWEEDPALLGDAEADEDMLLEAEDPDGEDEAAELLDAMHLWPGDAGTLPQDARAALLRLVKGPYVSEGNDAALWRALLNHADTIRSRLADLFLELCIDAEAGVAFSRNVQVEGKDFPKAATAYTMTMLDSIMVLLLRKELQTAGTARVFIGQAELYAQMEQYRAIETMDHAAYLKRLNTSWARLEKQRLLVKSDVEGRFEISPVLKLVFGAEEAAAVYDEYRRMRDERSQDAWRLDGDNGQTADVQDEDAQSERPVHSVKPTSGAKPARPSDSTRPAKSAKPAQGEQEDLFSGLI